MNYNTNKSPVKPGPPQKVLGQKDPAPAPVGFCFDPKKLKQSEKPGRFTAALREAADKCLEEFSRPGPGPAFISLVKPEAGTLKPDCFAWINKRNEPSVGGTLLDGNGRIEAGRAVHIETGELKTWCTRYAGYCYRPGTNTAHRLNCKSRQCEHCSIFWSLAWEKSIRAKVQADEAIGLKAPARTIVLTSAYDAGHVKFWHALRYFWEFIRAKKTLKDIQYWGVVEYNQDQTQPHFHFILTNDAYIPYAFLQECWRKAQRRAGFKKIAWNVWIEKIEPGNLYRYLLKYLGGAKGGKDEVPRPENWGGRYVRSSRKFFQHGRQPMLDAIRLQEWLIKIAAFQMDDGQADCQSGPAGRAFPLYSLRPAELSYFITSSDNEFSRLQYLITRKWDYEQDIQRATIVS